MGEQLVHAERERTEDALNVRRTRRQEVAPPPRGEESGLRAAATLRSAR